MHVHRIRRLLPSSVHRRFSHPFRSCPGWRRTNSLSFDLRSQPTKFTLIRTIRQNQNRPNSMLKTYINNLPRTNVSRFSVHAQYTPHPNYSNTSHKTNAQTSNSHYCIFILFIFLTDKYDPSLRIDWFIDWSTDSLLDSFIDWLIDWLMDGLMDGWIDWLIDCWMDWWIDWLIYSSWFIIFSIYCSLFAKRDCPGEWGRKMKVKEARFMVHESGIKILRVREKMEKKTYMYVQIVLALFMFNRYTSWRARIEPRTEALLWRRWSSLSRRLMWHVWHSRWPSSG